MSIQFACPICKTSYTVSDQDAGKKSDCKKCGQRLQVPAPPRAKTVLGNLNPEESPPDPLPFFEPPLERQITTDESKREEPYSASTEYHHRRKPGKAQAIAFMVLFGGIWAILHALGMVVSEPILLVWPGVYYAVVFGIIAIIRGCELLAVGRAARRSPRIILIMQIVAIVNGDIPNLVCGIIGLTFLNDPAVDRYYAPRGQAE